MDLRGLFKGHPWQSKNLLWNQMLDALRYLVVWNPVIVIAAQGAFYVTGLTSRLEHAAAERLEHAAAIANLSSGGMMMTPPPLLTHALPLGR